MKLTNKGDIDDQVQLLLSFPPSLMFDPVDVKAWAQYKGASVEQEKTLLGGKTLILFLLFHFTPNSWT